MAHMPYWIAGRARSGGDAHEVRSPFDAALIGTHGTPSEAEVDEALHGAHDVRTECARLSAAHRAAALDQVSRELARRSEEVAELITGENGKPVMWARAEVGRAVSTFRWAAEEARRFSGELQRLDTDPAAAGRLAVVRRFPIGPVLGITPFNFPLNLVAHKVAPAIAAGAPIVIKPAPATPLTALLLGEILSTAELPEGAWSFLPVDVPTTQRLVTDSRLPVISFTGSDVVGAQIREAAPHKHVTLELGGNAAAVVMPDWDDLTWAATRIATFANYQAGQSCISVQRVLVHESILDKFTDLLVDAVEQLATGSPWEERTVVGPVINEAAATRIETWITEAVNEGATVLTGGGRAGTMLEPTVVMGAIPTCRLSTEEVFGPVLTIEGFGDEQEAFDKVNDSRFGLQAGVFTTSTETAFRAHAELEVGGVVIGDVPSFRADQMPYGGVKNSGVGREGLKSAMQDYTYAKVMVLTGLKL